MKKKFDEKIFFTLNIFNTAIKKIKKKNLWKKKFDEKNFVYFERINSNKKNTFVINKRWIQKEEKIKDAK